MAISDFQLRHDYAPFDGPFGRPPSRIEGVSFFTVLQDQEDLKLESAHEVVDVLVIDSVERPTRSRIRSRSNSAIAPRA